jgi:hypothetical protein
MKVRVTPIPILLLFISSFVCYSQTTVGGGSKIAGSAVLGNPHFISLAWTASVTVGVTGYNVYRGTVSGGPYTLLTASPLGSGATSYNDGSPTSGVTYYYVATALVGASESAYSNETSATAL